MTLFLPLSPTHRCNHASKTIDFEDLIQLLSSFKIAPSFITLFNQGINIFVSFNCFATIAFKTIIGSAGVEPTALLTYSRKNIGDVRLRAIIEQLGILL